MTVKTRATINSEADANIEDNTSGNVTPADVRTRVKDLADSAAMLQEDLGLGSSVAAAATLSLGVGLVFTITGNTTITDIDFSTPWDGRMAILIFSGTPQVTHNATTLKLPGNANLTMAAGDRLLLVQESGDNIAVVAHIRAAGLDAGDIKSGTLGNSLLPTRLRQDTNHGLTDWNNATASGFYGADNATNAPTNTGSGNWYIGVVVALGTTYLHQHLFDLFTGRAYWRKCDNGTWTGWINNDTNRSGSRSFSGTTDTLLLKDAGGTVRSTGASAAVITVPPNSSVAFPVDTVINLEQYGAGQVSVAAGVGVTIRSSGSKLKISGQYSAAALHKIGTDEWMLFGDIAA